MKKLPGGITPSVYQPTHWISRIFEGTHLVLVKGDRVEIDGCEVGAVVPGFEYPQTINSRSIVITHARCDTSDMTYSLFLSPLPVRWVSPRRGPEEYNSRLLSWTRNGSEKPTTLILRDSTSSIVNPRHCSVEGPMVWTYQTLEGIDIRQSFALPSWGENIVPGLDESSDFIDVARPGDASYVTPNRDRSPLVWRVYNADRVFEGMLLGARFAFHDVYSFRAGDRNGISDGRLFIPAERPHAREMGDYPYLRSLHRGLTGAQWTKMVEILRLQYPADTFGEALDRNYIFDTNVAEQVKGWLRSRGKKTRRSGMFHGLSGAIIGVRRAGRKLRALWEFEGAEGKVFVVDSDEKTIGACFVFTAEHEEDARELFEFRVTALNALSKASGRFEHRGEIRQWLPPIFEHLRECGLDTSSTEVLASS